MTLSAPDVHGIRPQGVWDAHRVDIAFAGAALIPVAAMIAKRGSVYPILFAVGLAVLWHLAFARLRHRPMGWDGIATALVFGLMAPDAAPLWQQGLALSFGLVMGDLVFGGRGRGFLNPATVGLAFLLFSFPQTGGADHGVATAFAAMGSGAVLLALGLLSWRVTAGFMIAAFAASSPWAAPPDGGLANATLIAGLVFLVGDPVAAACTNPGRWAYGLLAGVLVSVFWQDGSTLAAVVFAALLASIFAPLIDQTVIWVNVRRRARRQRLG